MENGSFHTSPKALLETDDLVKNIPLPFEMPKGIDFSKAPIERSNASTVETLIGQNEDLMARLGVSLRRTTQLEEKLDHFEKENAMLRHRLETIKDSILVLQQKDQMASQRAFGLSDENTELKVQLKKLEQRYADLFIQAQDFQEQVMRLERYRTHVRRAAKSIQARAKQAGRLNALNVELATQQASMIQGFETKLNECKVEIDSLLERVQDRDQLFEEKVQIENRLIFVERQHENYRLDSEARMNRLEQDVRERIMSEFSEAQKHLNEEQQRVHTELHALQARVQIEMQELQETTRAELDIESRNIRTEIEMAQIVAAAELQDQRDQFAKELAQKDEFQAQVFRLTEEVEALREQSRIHIARLNDLSQSEGKARSELEALQVEEHNLREQVDTLQVLWQDKQRLMDKLEDKNSSLQRLNQQLSLNLNQARKEIYLLQNEMDFEKTQNAEQIKALREEIRLLQEKR